ncbi:calcium/sodium antiporter [Halobaculum marinum]|uniref:Calcium/sodium antiporter n=1 Tax=Halobaculum marinum TaxID=3031996 RepID=A0ABD5WVV2_9EURY|nr:calcium/sodium antiporter [Halobaculum sp. DT55]
MADIVAPVATFLLALAVLLAASDVFVSAAERVGLAFGVSPFIVGATVVAGGTSLPELVASTLAAREGATEIVVGSVVGSNVANILLIVGLVAVIGRRLRIDRELMRVDLPLLVASAAFLAVAVWTGPFVWYEGLLGLVGLVVYVHFSLSEEQRLDEVVEDIVAEHAGGGGPVEATPGDLTPDERSVDEAVAETTVGVRTALALLGSVAVVIVAADALVGAILGIATTLSIGAEFVAITALALGTSLPEIAVSVVAVRRGTVEIAVGNVLGSNVFNTFAVMSVPSFVAPITVPESVRGYALPVMVLATLLYYFVTQDREITRWEGIALLLVYAAFLLNLGTVV